MTIFKNYFKIINRHKFYILTYTVVFMVLMFFFTKSGSGESQYLTVKPRLFLTNKSEDSKLAKGLEGYLTKNFSLQDIKEENADDELFYEMIEAIIEIPENFEMGDEIIYKSSPNSTDGVFIKQEVNKYLSKVEAYLTADYKLDDALKFTDEDLEKEVKVDLYNKTDDESGAKSQYYFNFINYVIMSQIILIVSTVMLVYKDLTLSKRNQVSPTPNSSQVIQLTLGHLITGLVVWLLYIILFAIMWPGSMELKSTKLMMLNSFVFMATVVAMAMLLSRLIKNANMLSAVTNVVVLGSSFISGAFVPQELLSDTTLKIARLLPSYYYIANNNLLAKNPKFETMATNMYIIIGFGIAFTILSIILKQNNENK